ncbi:hypothetical protein EVAR_68338_1 [Eumeta japonica]|uniref:Uncharacterized protein n=1 Tax=Eumeta variegata TaxID=151549 RepID=A0A4C2A741_EUMVA|nr:hypothetical protein EVAR_68338_1 [Eumeta japonica]
MLSTMVPVRVPLCPSLCSDFGVAFYSNPSRNLDLVKIVLSRLTLLHEEISTIRVYATIVICGLHSTRDVEGKSAGRGRAGPPHTTLTHLLHRGGSARTPRRGRRERYGPA